MFGQYVRFFINGGVLGLAAWGLQLALYRLLSTGEAESSVTYAMASALTYVPLLIINFSLQRSFIFNRSGIFWRFVVANLLVMCLVSALSPLFRLLVDQLIGAPWGQRTGFAIAAIVGSGPSFLLKRTWVFGLSLK